MSMPDEMHVIKRDGECEQVSFDKILNRIKKIGQPLNLSVNYTALVMKIIDQIYENIETEKIDEILAQQCASMCSIHYDYYVLASHLLISNHQKKTRDINLCTYIDLLHESFKGKYISTRLHKLVHKYETEYESMIVRDRDYEIDYFGFKTLERAYLMRLDNRIIENIQYLWLRVAIQIHEDNLEKVKETYDGLSQKYFIHATPTLFNSGTKRPQLSSCFLLGMEEDSINGIFNTLKDCALISKWAGGIGLHIHNIRSNGSLIEGTNGKSHGIVPMLRVYNNTARYCDQGGKRHGSFAMYMEPWHADIEHYLELRKNHGDEEARARDLFYALWIPDYFMERVQKNETWHLMCPNQSPNLFNVYGDEFKALYQKYVSEGKFVKEMKARDLWFSILDSQMETGTPYMLYKDACNEKSNQKNLGTIKSSNLCVAGDTLVLTDEGNKIISTLENKTVNVWNGFEYSEVVIKKTGENQQLMRVETEDNKTLFCTPYHKFYVMDMNNNTIEKEARNLRAMDRIISFRYPNNENETILFIKEVYMTSRVEDTYCFTEPKRHMGVFNGILTGQCTEIIEFSNEEESAVCNLASISLPAFINEDLTYNFDKLSLISEILTENLNNIIDKNFYPTEKTKNSNFRHRPIGIGVQGLADVLARMKLPFDSNEAKELNKNIFEAIYYGAMKRSNELAKNRQRDMYQLQRFLIENMQKDNKAFWIWFIHAFKRDIFNEDTMTYFDGFTERIMQDSAIFHDVSCDVFKEKYETLKPTMREIFGVQFYKSMLNVIVECTQNIFEGLDTSALVNGFTQCASVIRNEMYCGTYSSFEGSPISLGKFQFDLWNEQLDTPQKEEKWNNLRHEVKKFGVRNSLCIAPMPTASTSQILGNNECFEPFTSNIYMRRTIAGEFMLVNRYLMYELDKLGLWTPALKNELIREKGSIQNIEEIPEELKKVFKVSWEISPETIIDMARDRAVFICQSQSMNLWVEDPNYKNLTKVHFYAWKKGVKTGMYYLRRKAKHQAQQFTVEPVKSINTNSLVSSASPPASPQMNGVEMKDDSEICELCSA